MSTEDVWVVTIPAKVKIEECVKEFAKTDKDAERIKNHSWLQQDDIVCFDSRREAKKYCLTHHYPLDYISVNED